MTTIVQDSYCSILKTIRSSPLNFALQETPYSIQITIRKSLRNGLNFESSSFSSPQHDSSQTSLHKLQEENSTLFSRCKSFEKDYVQLKAELEDNVLEIETKNEGIRSLESRIEILHDKLEAKEKQLILTNSKLCKVIEEERVFKKKHEAVCNEKKNLKSENEDLKSEVNNLKVALKTCRKEKKETDNRYEKKIHEYEVKIINLEDYKNLKLSEEKNLKSRNKKVEKRLKALAEKEAKVELEKNKVKKLLGSAVEEIASKKSSSMADQNSNLEQSASDCSSTLVKAGLEKKLGEFVSDYSSNTNHTTLNAVSSTSDTSCNMDLGFSTNTDPTSLDSETEDEDSVEKTELLDLLEAFADRTFKKIDDVLDNVGTKSTRF